MALEMTWLARLPWSNSARQILAPVSVVGRLALDPRLTHPQFVVHMHKAREMARPDAAKIVVSPKKSCRNARGHRERDAEIDPDDFDAVTHRLVNGQNRARQRSIVEPQAAIRAGDAAALQ